jgi:transcriptional regulator with XRE-family HTH domain
MTEGTHMMVQKLRVQRGWSQEQLAELSGLNVRTIQRIERGQTPSVESLKAIASVFEIHFDSLREQPDMTTPANVTVPNDEALALMRVQKIKGFYLHAAQYVIVMTVFCIGNALLYPRYFWAGWVAFSWGIGLIIHGLQGFELVPFLNGDWERRQVEKQLGRKLSS